MVYTPQGPARTRPLNHHQLPPGTGGNSRHNQPGHLQPQLQDHGCQIRPLYIAVPQVPIIRPPPTILHQQPKMWCPHRRPHHDRPQVLVGCLPRGTKVLSDSHQMRKLPGQPEPPPVNGPLLSGPRQEPPPSPQPAHWERNHTCLNVTHAPHRHNQGAGTELRP